MFNIGRLDRVKLAGLQHFKRRGHRIAVCIGLTFPICLLLHQRVFRNPRQGADSLSPPVEEVAYGTCRPAVSNVMRELNKSQEANSLPAVTDLVAMGVPGRHAAKVAQLARHFQGQSADLAHPLVLARFVSFHSNANVTFLASKIFAAQTWRREINLQAIMKEWGVLDQEMTWRRWPQTNRAALGDRHFCAGRVCGKTHNGGPLVVARAGTCDVDGIVGGGLVGLMLNQLLFLFEEVLQAGHAASVQRSQLISGAVVIDMTGISISVLRHVPTLGRLVDTINMHYPDLVRTITIVNAPYTFTAIWRAVSPFLAPSTRGKVQILGYDFGPELEAHAGIDLTTMPRFLGGYASDAELPPAQPVREVVGFGLDLSFGGKP